MNNDTKVKLTFALGNDFEYILLKVAIHFAELGKNIWYISSKKFEKLPANIEPPDKEVQKLITFIYLKTYKDLIQHLNEVHTWRKVPQFIILNGFYERYDPNNQASNSCLESALLITSLLDCANFCSLKNNDKTFVLIASDKSYWEQRENTLKSIIDLYFNDSPLMLCSEQEKNYELIIKNISH